MFGMLVFLTNLSLVELQARNLTLFLIFHSNSWLKVVLDEKFLQEYPVKTTLPSKAPSLFLHFSCCTLMTFLMMLSVMLLSMMMILHSTVNMIRHLTCGNIYSCSLIFNLTYGKLWTRARSG